MDCDPLKEWKRTGAVDRLARGARLCAGQGGTSRSIPNVATRCGWSSTQPRSGVGSSKVPTILQIAHKDHEPTQSLDITNHRAIILSLTGGKGPGEGKSFEKQRPTDPWRLVFGFFILLLSALALHAQTHARAFGANHLNIQYGKADGQKLFLDAHAPSGTGPFPILIIVHGGGWMGGDKEEDIVPVLARYATNFTWFTISYRLAPTNRWPACFDDVQTAVSWVKQHGTEYKGDPDRIALLGYSAGGHLVTLAGTLAAEDVHVQAIVGMAPPSDLIWDNERRGGLSTSMTNLFDYATTNITDDRRVVLKRYSPLTYVKPGLQPFLLVQGTADRTVPFRETTNFMASLQGAGVTCDLLVITNGQHRIKDWSKYHPDWQEQVVSWLNDKLAR